MREPKVELKKVETFQGHDGVGFNADVWIDGVKCTHVHDGAYGGEYEYTNYIYQNPQAELIKEKLALLDAYIKSLPEIPMEINGEPFIRDGEQVMLKKDLDWYLNDKLVAILETKERKKAERKFNTLQEKALIFGTDITDYAYYKFAHPLGRYNVQQLQKRVDELVAKECKGDVKLLNTNLKEIGITV